MKKSTKFKILFYSVTMVLIIFSNVFKEIAILLISGALITFISKDIFHPERKRLEDKEIEKESKEKQINYLFRIVHLFIEYLQSSEYYNNSRTSDERVKYEISFIKDNIEELREYLAFNIYGDPDKYDKKMTFLKGRYIITFRSHTPYQSKIHRWGRVYEFNLSEQLEQSINLLNIMYKEIKDYIKDEFDIIIKI